jgi:ABC-2 type transport system permease protein
VARQASQIVAPVRLVTAQADNQTLDAPTYLAAGMAVFFLFFTVQLGVISYLEERQQGTLARVLAAPLQRWHVLAAKGLTSLLVGVVSTGTLVVATSFLVGARWGDPFGVAVLVVAGVLSATILVSMVSLLARTAEQANVWQSIFAIVLGMLGGAFFPVVNGPGLLAQLSLITPHAWFLRGLGTLRGGGGVVDILPAAAAMLVFPLIVVLVGSVLGRTRFLRRRMV